MLNLLRATNLGLGPVLAILLPLALWAALWLSLTSGPGNIQGIFHPGGPVGFLHGLRAIFPIVAAAGAIPIILAGVSRQRSQRYLLFGPLGLAAVYGLVGLASFLLSPDRLVALYWVAVYLSVPLVLWAIVWGSDTPAQLRRLINFNWLIIVLAVAVALRYLDIGSAASDPSALLECRLGQSWFKASGEVLRQTGVGRYAAVAGLIALAGLWRGGWRPVWSLVLVGSLTLLLTSGARTAFVGFACAAAFVVLLYGGKKAAVAGSAVLIVLVLVAWGTGFHQSFLNSCILRGWTDPSKQSAEPVRLEVPPGNWALQQVLPQEPGPAAAPAQIPLPPGEWALQKSSSPQTSGSEATHSVPIKPGEWVLQPSASLPEVPSAQVQSSPPAVQSSTQAQPPAPASSKLPRPVHVPPGKWVLVRVSPGDSPAPGGIPEGFFTFSGRTVVWAQGWQLFQQSPWLGYGFHADRLILVTHMHNSFMHALVQTGLMGTIPFVAAILLGWVLLLKAFRNLARLPVFDKHLVIQTAGILAFLTIRSITESTGAFFGVDWLLLAPLLLYLQVVNRRQVMGGGPS